jgi:hypothetical protein
MKTEKRWFTTGSGRIEFYLTLEDAGIGHHSGQCDADVEYLRGVPYIAKQLAEIDSATLAGELREYGAWDDVELSNHDENLARILWIACGDIQEEEFMRESETEQE